uniref:Ubiquitin-like domain-containing protein n=1 Tax=Lotharella globosa TaxID=91324 RepID=A0A7S3YVI7_9EUKA
MASSSRAQVFVEGPFSSKIVALDPSTGLADLKDAIARETGIPAEIQRITCGGKALSQSTLMGELDNSTVVVALRVLGGGGDGGSIPGRMDLVKTAKTHTWWMKEATREDPSFQMSAPWTMCSLTNEKLAQPVYADQMGHLYNKEALLKYIVGDEKKAHFTHIKAMRDAVEVKITVSKAKSEPGDHPLGWVCPVTGKPVNGKRRFYVVWGCGCLVSKEAVNQLGSKNCPRCTRELDPELNELVMMTPPVDEMKAQYQQMKTRNAVLKERRKAAKRLKKANKAKAKADPEAKSAMAPPAPKKATAKTDIKKIAPPKKKKRHLSAVQREIQENLKKAKKQSKVFSSIFLTKRDFENDERTASTSFISTKPRSMNALT